MVFASCVRPYLSGRKLLALRNLSDNVWRQVGDAKWLSNRTQRDDQRDSCRSILSVRYMSCDLAIASRSASIVAPARFGNSFQRKAGPCEKVGEVGPSGV